MSIRQDLSNEMPYPKKSLLAAGFFTLHSFSPATRR
jgi:hypothetical protein